MRVIITASGIQDYLFNIMQRAAGVRLRGRSARLGLVIDCCLQLMLEKFGKSVGVKRNAGSRLEVEISRAINEVSPVLDDLQHKLDEFSLTELNGQVWFTVALGESKTEAYRNLAQRKLAAGHGLLLRSTQASEPNSWIEEKFLFAPSVSERGIEKENATSLPEARLGKILSREERPSYIQFVASSKHAEEAIKILDRSAEVSVSDPGGVRFALAGGSGFIGAQPIRKRLARYAPRHKTDDRLMDLDEIADESLGAKFLGVLKADLDNLGTAFSQARTEDGNRKLSDEVEELFAEKLEILIRQKFPFCYIVYSGGDDLFILGPWDQVLRFIASFEPMLQTFASQRNLPITISAGFRLAHPKSPIRFLADDTERALRQAKRTKNCIGVFERTVAWKELRTGLQLADDLISAVAEQGLSKSFLQRLQYYADEFRRLEEGCIDGLRMIPLMENDWQRNASRISGPVREKLESIRPQLANPAEGAPTWRQLDFGSRFAFYATR